LAGGALAVACFGGLVYLGSLARTPLMAVELSGNGRHALVATIDPRNETVLTVPADLAVTGNRIPQL
jgi:hypothetical protein